MEKDRNDCPYSSANFFSIGTVWWMNSYFKKGYKQKLVSPDLYQISDEDRSAVLTEQLSRNWNEECKNAENNGRKPSFGKAFWKTFIRSFMLNAILVVVAEFLKSINPLLIGEISKYFISPSMPPLWYPYSCAACLTLSSFMCIFVETIFVMNLTILGWNARSAVVGLMYEKTLKLNHKAFTETSKGKIVNLSSNDAMKFDMAFFNAHYIWIAPLECAILTYVLWLQLGNAAFVAISVLFLLMIIETLLGKVFGYLRLLVAKATDERIQATNELISSMRIVKMYSWEKSFQELINDLRKKEMRRVFYDFLVSSISFTTNISTNLFLSFATFITVVLMQGDLDLHTVIVSLGIFLVLLQGAGLAFPWSVEIFFKTLATIKRIEKFLLLPEITPRKTCTANNPSVNLRDFSASWPQKDEGKSFGLRNVSIEVKKGELLMVVGPVGSGKSSLLSAILGEFPASSGQICVDGNLAYASQIPWLFSGTICENIIFGGSYDSHRFQKVIEACALDRDLQTFPKGELTLVGERGVTLSGGQKARVSLARLAYHPDLDIAVMDDPLSAVDSSVASHLFEKCICGLLNEKVRILVTHQLQFLEQADKILIMEKGRIAGYGTYQELLQKGIDFGSLIENVKKENDNGEEIVSENEEMIKAMWNRHRRRTLRALLQAEKESTALLPQPECKIKEENNNPNSISFQGFIAYIRGNLPFYFMVMMLATVISSHVLYILSDWWLARWAVASEKHIDNMTKLNASPTSATTMTSHDDATAPTSNYSVVSDFTKSFDHYYYLYVYAGLMVGFFVSMYIRTAMHYYACIQSSINLHAKMLASVLKTKIRFFDTNPVGAILNRFTKDMGQIDERLPKILFDVFYHLGVVLSVVIFVIIINWFVVIIVIPIAISIAWLRKYYVVTSREIKRVEGQDRSPVFSHLSASLEGIVTIRTFREQQSFSQTYHKLQDIHGASWSATFFGRRWFECRLDMAAATFIAWCAFFSVLLVYFLPEDGPINAGNMSLTLTFAVSLIIWFKWGIKQCASAENLMTSVERIYEYHQLPGETNSEVVGQSPSPIWPENGSISFTNLKFAHFEGGPSVLKNINLQIKPKEKFGIIGRTGAGKSSIVAAIFRLSDQISGSIKIDDVEASQVDLQRWRSVLTVIPQDPVLFQRSMRKNLDPFSDYTDNQIWNALEKVRLKEFVQNLSYKLETVLAESGSDLSVGQRQLVCLARAILRENKILIIDEATANVDNRTDRLIQETIRNEFSDCTVVTIAHRLDTVINSDRILVLDEGKVLECDEPYILLQNSSGALSRLLRMTGRREAELRNIAEITHQQRHAEEVER